MRVTVRGRSERHERIARPRRQGSRSRDTRRRDPGVTVRGVQEGSSVQGARRQTRVNVRVCILFSVVTPRATLWNFRWSKYRFGHGCRHLAPTPCCPPPKAIGYAPRTPTGSRSDTPTAAAATSGNTALTPRVEVAAA